MRFVFVAPRFHTNQYEIVNTLIHEGHSVEFHTLLIGPTEEHSILKPKVFEPCFISRAITWTFGEGGVNKRRSFPNPYNYLMTLRERKPDFIIVRDPIRWFSFLAALCSRLQGIKVIFYSQTPLYKQYSFARTTLTNLLLKVFDAAWYTPLRGNKRSKENQHPNWMYFVPFAVPIWTNRVDILPKPKIIMVGKMETRKNHVLLIKAISLFKHKYQFSLTMVSECATKEHEKNKLLLINAIKKLGVSDIVQLHFNVKFKNMKNLYLNHNLFVLPSTDEPASISVLEAFANGIPSICSDTNGTRYYITENVNGFIFRDGDVRDLAEKIEFCISDKYRLRAMQKSSIELGSRTVTRQVFYNAFSNMLNNRWPRSLE
jgi:glycosyltransferase involved in cell wall biosynthesis